MTPPPDVAPEFTLDTDGLTGAAVPARAQLVGGTDGTNLRGILVDSSGRPLVNLRKSDGTELIGQQVNATSIPTVLSSEQKDVDTAIRTGAEKVFSASTNLINVGTSETAFFYLKNPNASGKVLKLMQLRLTCAGGTARLYHTPTTSANGTALSIVNNRIKTSPAATVVQAFSSPTASAFGTLMDVQTLSSQSGTITWNLSWLPHLEANFNFLVTITAAANNTPSHTSAVWEEI